MASIRNSINLQDHMTPVFRSIIKSMDSTLRVMRQLDKQANNGAQSKAYKAAQRDLNRANNELIKMQNNLSRCDKEAKHLSSSTKNISFSKAGSGLSSFLTGLSSALYLAKNIAAALSNVMEAPDTMSAIKYRLETYDTSNATGGQLFDNVYKTAQDSRSDVKSTADLASRILISGATDGSGAEATKLAGILNKASFLGGSSSQESQRALLQLSQGLASGALQGDELRAIREQAPGLTDTLAKGLSSLGEKGLLPEKFIGTTMGDLKQLGSEGELTSARIVAAFREMEDYVDTTFKKSPKQFGQAVTGILNVWKRWLGLMGEGDNALAKINQKAWELLEWFESDEGDKFFTDLANGVNFVVDCILGLIDGVAAVIRWFSSLETSSEILQSAFITLGTVAVAGAIAAAVAWAIANWQMLLVVLAIGLVIYAFLAMGFTAGEVIGGICGALGFLGILIYDIIIFIIGIVATAVMMIWNLIMDLVIFVVQGLIAVGTAALVVIQFIVQLIMWAITTIWQFLLMLDEGWKSLWYGFQVVVGGVVVGIVQIFQVMATAVLGILYGIAAAIDWVFGSNLADTVNGWIKGLDSAVDDLEANFTANVSGGAQDISEGWKNWASNAGDMYAGKGKYDDWNITDNMADLWNGGTDLYNAVGNGMRSAQFSTDQLAGVENWTFDNGLHNPMNGWNWGMGAGKDLGSTMGDFSMKLEEFGDSWKGGFDITGGDLDSVGSIGSDVDISDEDIQLLRDVAARDFLLTLQTSTPQVNNNFGDIKETADVNKILEVIQDMVDEQLAVSLVVE